MLKITILGSGNAFGHENQFQSSHFIEFAEKYKILLDCGPTILQAVQTAEINIDDLQYLLISHLHGDHMAGIPFLLLHYKFVLHRTNKPLTIIGPPGIAAQVDALLKGNYPIAITKEDNLFDIQELQVQQEKQLFDDIRIKGFEAHHIPNAFGYVVQYKNLKLIYSGDNKFNSDQMKELTNGTVLIHELTTMDSTEGIHTSWQLLKNHIDEILTNVGKVIVVHTGSDVRKEPESTFNGKIIRAQDGSYFLFNENGRMYQMVL